MGKEVCKSNADFLDLVSKIWSNKNNQQPSDYTFGSNKYIWLKCEKINYHEDYLITCNHFSQGNRCPYCKNTKVHFRDSFAQYHIDNTDINFIEKYWSDKNKNNPWEISPHSSKYIYVKCQNKNYHDVYKITCDKFTNGQRCPYCSNSKIHPNDSFAQYHINNTDFDFINKYWSSKNNKTPFSISPNSDTKIYIKCTNVEYHSDYVTSCSDFTRGRRCPYCAGKQIHPLDSFGEKYKDVLDNIWDYNKNTKTPFKINVCSSKKIWIKCECNKHGSYLVSTLNYSYGRRCPLCSISNGEKEITACLTKNKFAFIFEKRFEGLFGLGNGSLSYDFYLPSFNLLIEYQGEQHERPIDFNGFGVDYAKKQFKIQQEHDRLKREYAKNSNIKLLEIWYYDFDNIEKILKKELNLD